MQLKIKIILALAVIWLACSEKFPDQPRPNQPPETFISFFTENELNASISQQTFHWWGDDPDGMISGFIYTFKETAENVAAWDSTAPHPEWTFTTRTSETFNLTLSGTDTVYTFKIKAIDDQGAADPTPAIQRFPIINTRPSVEFPAGTEVPETTFTIAAFSWSASDLDGDETIAKFQYVLDDTSQPQAWKDLSAKTPSIILSAANGLTEGDHVFYLRALDIAGASSAIIRMPRSPDDIWHVKEPKSKFLLIDDYNVADNTDQFYQSVFQSLLGAFDVWDIKSNNKALEPRITQAFTQTLLLFERIFWYSDTEPNLEKAQIGLQEFLEQNGKVIMTTSFGEFTTNQGDPVEFSPADSLGAKIRRITRNQLVQPSAAFAALGFPQLQVNKSMIPNVFPLVPKISSEILYVLPENPANWPGTPAVGVIDAQRSFVFFSLPLAAINGQDTVDDLIAKILTDIF